MKIEVSKLTGKALDWAVQYALLMKRGAQESAAREAAVSWAKSGDRAFSTDWNQCGPRMRVRRPTGANTSELLAETEEGKSWQRSMKYGKAFNQ